MYSRPRILKAVKQIIISLSWTFKCIISEQGQDGNYIAYECFKVKVFEVMVFFPSNLANMANFAFDATISVKSHKVLPK